MTEHPEVLAGLLSSACPSIQYRLRREILGEPPETPPLETLKSQIWQTPLVQQLQCIQQPDGWLGQRFHGYDSLEGWIRLLCEMGLQDSDTPLAGALAALLNGGKHISQELGLVGNLLDDHGLGGTEMIRAALFAQAGLEDLPLVKDRINRALASFRYLMTVESLTQVTESYRGKHVFLPAAHLPGIYHLRLLTYSQSWRSPETHALLCAAVQRLVELSPMPQIYLRHKSQLIAPAAFRMQDFNPALETLDSAQWMIWFQRVELLARLGVIPYISALNDQISIFQEILKAGGGWFTLQIAHPYFQKWGAYTGLMLEKDWKSSRRRIFDLTFRGLIIQTYAKPMR